ncbi:Cysteine-rich receptor-like protein kinase 4 [Linum perenne]
MDFSWSKDSPNDLANIGTLFKEWRAGINSEVRTAGERKLLLTAALDYAPGMGVRNFPVGSIRKHLDWVHVMAQNLESSEVMEPDAPLNDPEFLSATRSGIDAWISVGKVDPGKLVLSLPLYGFAWKLANPEEENYIGARVSGPAVNEEGGGFLSYGQIKEISNGTKIMYNSTYAVNYCTVNGSVSVIFDGPEAIRAKVSYTTEMELGGYYVWQIPYDYNGELALLAGILRVEDIEGSGDFGKNDTVPNLRVYSFEEINKATNRFSLQNKLGRGGYGPVYKGVLPDGQEIAVKKLSETSTQGLHEFKNEVQLNARIQHVNLVRVLGYCIDNDEKMLIYEFMPNNSLDKYLYDSAKRNILDWSRRVEIIQGITQGLVYLQEYSRLPIIHRDLKASNILLDSDFLPKISDFGIAKVFSKNGQETNTVRIVGTIGYTPPEYFSQGTYSVKSDVYGFGVLLLQIITSKKVARIYGPAGDSSLQEYAFELWEDGRGMEIVEPSLDDTSSSCKLLTCLRIALLCVQDDPIDRPSMLQVASMLRNETVVGSLFPKRPTFSFRKQQQQQQGDNNNITEPAVFQPEFCSIADATITQLDGR